MQDHIMLADGFEEAFIGIGQQFTHNFAVYDHGRCVRILVERDGMTEEEAEDWVGYNIEGAYVGELTPLIVQEVPESGA